jgi:hypothetical protein
VIVLKTGNLGLKGDDRLAHSTELFTRERQAYMPTLRNTCRFERIS